MIIILKNPNGDTRTAPKDVTFTEFQEANDLHIRDVDTVMHGLALKVAAAGIVHDFTKKSYEKMFWEDFKSTLENSTDFTEGKWYQMHVNTERRHLLSHCPDDVNLIDVLEMIVDCTCAGLARSGEVRDLEINSDILDRAVKNTCELVKPMVKVEEV